MVQSVQASPCLMLASRDQYMACHIRVPDLAQRLAAIRIGGSYYSFFRMVDDSRKALSLTVKLCYRGDKVALTRVAKGYGLWILEPEAQPTHLERIGSTSHTQLSEPALCRIMVSRTQYQSLAIRVPDLEQPLDAIQVNGNYYSIFRIETDLDRLIEIVAKTTRRGDETIILRIQEGYAICVWEPEVQPIQKNDPQSFNTAINAS
jgi:hypothetical protein